MPISPTKLISPHCCLLHSLQDNAQEEWGYKKAVTIQTYSCYHPVIAPLNLISLPLYLMIRRCCQQKIDNITKSEVRKGNILACRAFQITLVFILYICLIDLKYKRDDIQITKKYSFIIRLHAGTESFISIASNTQF